MDLERELDVRMAVAERAARRAGHTLMTYYGHLKGYARKSEVDPVSEADHASERVIVEELRAAFPGDALLLEEGGVVAGDGWQWVVDPLDGTTDFVHAHPVFAVSIGLVAPDGALAGGVVFAPAFGELWSARRGRGATLDGAPIHVSDVRELRSALVATGFPYDSWKRPDAILAYLREVLRATQGLRRLGSAALDLCFVACGRLDAYFEESLKGWDVAAGMLILEEAGGRLSRYDGRPTGIHDEELLVSNGHLHDAMVGLLTSVPGAR